MSKIEKILGYKKHVETIKSICDFLKDTDKYLDFGADIPKGLFICGPSGVGKTFMAEALMEDCGRETYYFNGYGRKGISSLFDRIYKDKKKANKKGQNFRAVVLFDDIDDYVEDKNSPECDQLMSEMEGVREGDVFVILTAKKREDMPENLLKEGEIDIEIELEKPDFEDSQELLKLVIDGKKLDEKFDFDDFCYFAEFWTYPLAVSVVNKAALMAVYEGSEAISMKHIVAARMKDCNRPLTYDYDAPTAYHEAGHAATHMLLGGEPCYIALGEENSGLYSEKYTDDETIEERQRRYMVGLSGRLCEEIFFGKTSLGSSGDLKKVAERLDRDLSKLGLQGFDYFDSTTDLNSPEYNNKLANKIQYNMNYFYDKARKLIEENKQFVVNIAEKLKEKPYLLHSELKQIYNEYMASKK